MFRRFAFVSALVAAAALSTRTLAAQSSASSTKPAPAAHAKMDTAKTATSATATTAKPAKHGTWTADQVKEAQQGLAKAGLYKGTATGHMNKETEKALKEYQKENHMPVTGKLSDSVLVKLKTA
jgi:peptidoglycan hydrolase-like protein with peptidoglycan-binding domain